MIWFLLGVLPLAALYVHGLTVDPGATLIVTGVAVLLFGCVFAAVYGAYDMGWIMQCGGDDFWTAKDC